TLSYTIDIYRGKLEPAKNILDFAFFVSFFPQLVAGPIVRALDFIPQIYEKYRITTVELNRAYFLIIVGLVKKIMISDYLAENFVDRIFESPTEHTGFENLLAVYGYALQIYCDFSGYTDIAIGIALLLGFRLPLNFNSPYKALSITDFWRRWHISLSSWLRDYLYISLGGNRKGKTMTRVNLMITMLLGGLWHGAHLKFVLWGGMHGAALIFHKTWSEITRDKIEIPRGLAILITFHFVCLCWIFFRASDVFTAKMILLQIIDNFQFYSIFNVVYEQKIVILLLLLGYIGHFLSTDVKLLLQYTFTSLPDFVKSLLAVFIIIFLFQVKSSGIQPFIYFQF
ncbi:MAG: MBOAT family protein, partial [Candidatus Calescibacterium sp.]|nr:MBOAT family protein [Candidatus Calescibacterium sp.]MDW8287249.1 MBOAT family O-acyltransferase [Flammeovirgaceae bacterium]